MREQRFLVAILLLAAVALFVMVGPAWAQHTGRKFVTYSNGRFAYSISYPASLLIPQGEATNGDGQKFLSRDGRTTMLVYGRHNIDDQTLPDLYKEEVARPAEAGERKVTYKSSNGDSFVVSGLENGKVFYTKTILKGGVVKTFRIDYEKSDAETWNPLVARIALSFKG
jgi:hypothetical protein